MSFVARVLKEDELDEALALHLELFPVVYSMTVMKRYLRKNYLAMGLWYVSNDHQRLIGVATAQRSWKDFFSTERTAYLCTFGITKEFRQQHLGTQFLDLFSKILYRHFHSTVMYLDMQRINTAALKFYQKFGFSILEVRPNHYEGLPGPDGAQDSLYMGISLAKVAKRETETRITLDKESSHLMDTVPPLTWLNSFFETP